MATVMDTVPLENVAEIPQSVYLVVGFLIITNLGTIFTVFMAGGKAVYKFAEMVTNLKALHRRVDALENKKRSYDDDSEDENEH
jgi:hypothetical protein